MERSVQIFVIRLHLLTARSDNAQNEYEYDAILAQLPGLVVIRNGKINKKKQTNKKTGFLKCIVFQVFLAVLFATNQKS